MAHPKILAFVLAGGKGERLFPLTSFRSKPSVPFGGKYRIVDFVLSNLVNSHVYSIYLLVQYKSQSLIDHVRKNWVLSSVIKDHFVTVVPPQMRMGPEWFQGTADAVFQNISVMKELNPELHVFARARYLAERAWLEEIGTADICIEEAETAIGLAILLLRVVGADGIRIQNEIVRIRKELGLTNRSGRIIKP